MASRCVYAWLLTSMFFILIWFDPFDHAQGRLLRQIAFSTERLTGVEVSPRAGKKLTFAHPEPVEG